MSMFDGLAEILDGINGDINGINTRLNLFDNNFQLHFDFLKKIESRLQDNITLERVWRETFKDKFDKTIENSKAWRDKTDDHLNAYYDRFDCNFRLYSSLEDRIIELENCSTSNDDIQSINEKLESLQKQITFQNKASIELGNTLLNSISSAKDLEDRVTELEDAACEEDEDEYEEDCIWWSKYHMHSVKDFRNNVGYSGDSDDGVLNLSDDDSEDASKIMQFGPMVLKKSKDSYKWVNIYKDEPKASDVLVDGTSQHFKDLWDARSKIKHLVGDEQLRYSMMDNDFGHLEEALVLLNKSIDGACAELRKKKESEDKNNNILEDARYALHKLITAQQERCIQTSEIHPDNFFELNRILALLQSIDGSFLNEFYNRATDLDSFESLCEAESKVQSLLDEKGSLSDISCSKEILQEVLNLLYNSLARLFPDETLKRIKTRLDRKPLHPREIFLNSFLGGKSVREFLENRFPSINIQVLLYYIHSLNQFIYSDHELNATNLYEITGIGAQFWQDAYDRYNEWEKNNGQ